MSRPLRIGLWAVQILLFGVFTGTGVWKLLTPIPQLAAMIPWAGEVPAPFLHATAVLDILGGIGVLLPRLTVLAALGCAALQVGAVIFHLSRGEAADTPFNVLLAALALAVAWGRRRA